MSSTASFLAFVFLVLNASALGLETLQKAAPPKPGMNLECVARHCLLQAGSCMENKDCRASMGCSLKCMDEWDSDKTSEKFHIQNCTNICQFSYRGKPYDDIMECIGDNKCLSLPPIPSQCKAPGNITLLKKLPTSALNGSWWVVRGHHPVYDCYPCQHLLFKQINSTSWIYKPTYQVYLVNGSLGWASDPYVIPDTTAGEKISFLYHDVGLYHYETWWVIDEADDKSYILVYYCGNTLEWYYDGALVLSREKTLSSSAYEKIAESFKKATGLDTGTFCDNRTDQCTD